jgi:hypothetical protein
MPAQQSARAENPAAMKSWAEVKRAIVETSDSTERDVI